MRLRSEENEPLRDDDFDHDMHRLVTLSIVLYTLVLIVGILALVAFAIAAVD